MLLTKEVEVKVTPNTYKYYKDLGYNFEHSGDNIIVDIKDLPKSSHVKVDVLCDYCKEEKFEMPYYHYNNGLKSMNKIACKKCKGLKYKECFLELYGVESTMCLDSIKEKSRNTCFVKYGVSNPAKINEIQNRRKQTLIDKYGSCNLWEVPEIKNKYISTTQSRYGVHYYSQTNEYAERYKSTCNAKFGVDYPLQSQEVREKMSKTYYRNSSKIASIQQIYLCELYDGELNYPIKYYNVDICFPKEKIIIEYNGGGHNLTVKIGKTTQEDFNQREIVRNSIIKREGYKQITIISPKDLLPSDEILLQMLKQAKQYFDSTTHTWVEYNLDTSLMRNAEHKDGVFFNFGILRKIGKKAS